MKKTINPLGNLLHNMFRLNIHSKAVADFSGYNSISSTRIIPLLFERPAMNAKRPAHAEIYIVAGNIYTKLYGRLAICSA